MWFTIGESSKHILKYPDCCNKIPGDAEINLAGRLSCNDIKIISS